MAKMLECPGCGTANSVKRQDCYVCGAVLHHTAAGTNAPEERVCLVCCYASIFPPPGISLDKDEIWCAHQEQILPACSPAGECFSVAFGWGREQILG